MITPDPKYFAKLCVSQPQRVVGSRRLTYSNTDRGTIEACLNIIGASVPATDVTRITKMAPILNPKLFSAFEMAHGSLAISGALPSAVESDMAGPGELRRRKKKSGVDAKLLSG